MAEITIETGHFSGGRHLTGDRNADASGLEAIIVQLMSASPIDLASTANGKGASLVGIEDSAGKITGTTVETALAELALWKYDIGLTTNGNGASLVGIEDAAARITGATVETALAELAARALQAAASEAAIKAIPAAARTDGSTVIDLTNNVLWQFDAGSAAGASAWVLVPDAGTGRWLRNQPSLADLAALTNGNGASLIGIEDAGTIITATNVEAALAELKTLIDAGMQVAKKTLTLAHTDFDGLGDLDTSETINLDTALPANARIVGVDFHTYTPFTGGGNSAVTVDIGTAGDIDALIDGADLFAAAVDGGPATIPQGIRPNKKMGAAQLIATFGADVGLKELTAGAITIDVTYVVLA